MDQPNGPSNVSRCPIQADYNPFAPETIDDPIAAVSLRAQKTPVFYSPIPSWWTVSRYEDVLAVLADTDRFSSAAVLGVHTTPEDVKHVAPCGDPSLAPGLINSDPPAHRRLRRLAVPVFSTTETRRRTAQIEALATELLGDVVPKGECDIVEAFAMPLPVVVLSAMIGIPREDALLMHGWSEALMKVRSPLEGEARREVWRQVGTLTEYLDDLIAERKQTPRDDYVTKLLQAREGDEPMLTSEEVRTLIAQLIPAGNETTRYLIAGLARRIAENPKLADELRTDDRLVPLAVEEELRHSGTAKGLFRVGTEDVELGGAVIPRGDIIHVYFAGANRDGSVFDRPDEFDLTRQSTKGHLAFGKGEHFCLGAPLARVEAEIALRQMLHRLPNLRRSNDQPLQWIPSAFVRGIQRLDVRWDTSSRSPSLASSAATSPPS